MAVVQWAPGISTVSGALKKINKKSEHARDQQMLLATHRVAPTTVVGKCNRLYVRDYNDTFGRSTPLSADEILIRNCFAAISRAVKARRHDLSKIAADQAAYLAQRNLPNGIKSMQGWYWAQEGAAYDEAHS